MPKSELHVKVSMGAVKPTDAWASLVAQMIKNLPAVAVIPGSGRSSGEGNGNPFQYSCLENSMGRGAWWVWWPTVHGNHKESDTTEQLTFLLSHFPGQISHDLRLGRVPGHCVWGGGYSFLSSSDVSNV